MKAYPTDLRQKIIEACQRGQATQRAVAEFFGVSVSFVEKLLQRYCTPAPSPPDHMVSDRNGDLTATPTTTRPGMDTGQPDPGSGPRQALTLVDMQTKTCQELGISLSLAALCRTLKRLGLTRKKSPSTPPNVTPNGRQARQCYRIGSRSIPFERLTFVDERASIWR